MKERNEEFNRLPPVTPERTIQILFRYVAGKALEDGKLADPTSARREIIAWAKKNGFKTSC